MRIAHVGNFKPDSTNGVNSCIYNIATNQALLGNEVYVYSFDSIKIVKREKKNAVNHVIFPLNKFLGRFILSNEFKLYLKKNVDCIDVFHLHSVFTPYNNSIAKYIDKRYIITPHGGYSQNCLKRSFFSFIKKKIYSFLIENRYIRKAYKIQALNSNEKKDLLKYGVDENKIFIAGNGIAINNISFNKNLHNYCKTILFIGRLDKKHKGLDLLIHGFDKFIKDNWIRKGDIKLIIAGPDTHNHLKDLKKLVQKSKIEDWVCFKDRVVGEEKHKLFVSANVFVHTSRWEGLPISVLEALSFGIPVLVSEQTNVGDLTKAYDAGVVVNLDISSIADGFKSIFESDLEQMSINAYKLASLEFDWKKNVETITDNYKVVV